MESFRRALGFLTICPVRASATWTPETLGSSMAYYPLVGACLGLALWGWSALLSLWFAPAIVSVLLLAASLFLTGGLHIDGFADLIDGLSGSYQREEALRIFKDPHVGSMAVAGVVVLLLLKYACLTTLLPDTQGPVLVMMATLSRYAMVQLAYFSAYARATGGLGEPFVRGIRSQHLLTALLFTLGIVGLCGGFRGLAIGIVVGVVISGLQGYFRRRLGGITGDVLGATNEGIEGLVLLGAALGH